MTTGDPVVDASIARLAAEAPELTADQFSVISGLLKRIPKRTPSGASAAATRRIVRRAA
jgi:hypothetical protein